MTDISIIVCTLNRSESLAKTLDSITMAIGDMTDIEAVIIDNGSSQETSIVIKEWEKNQSFSVKTAYEKRRGLSYARNTGIDISTGYLLAFTDDDCRLHPDYFVNLKKHYHLEVSPVLRGGKVELGDPTDLPFTIKTDETPSRMTYIDHPGCFIVGANMIIPRIVIDTIGQFDTRFGAGAVFKASEDVDIVLRAHRAGFIIEYQPDIIVKHFHGRKIMKDINDLCKGYFIGTGALYAKHWYDIRFLKHFYWDLRKWLKNGTFNEDVGISYTPMIKGCIKGFFLYWKRAFIDRTFGAGYTSPNSPILRPL